MENLFVRISTQSENGSFKRVSTATNPCSETIYPPSKQIFNALNTTPLQDVKVVILGQDPYHGPNQQLMV